MTRRRELWYVGAFALLNLVVPLTVGELYPFSSAPMFADAPRCYCDYSLVGPGGEALDLVEWGLHRTYWGNPPVGMGFHPPPSLDTFGEVCGVTDIREHLETRLTSHPELSYVIVTRKVVADRGDGTVGVVHEDTLRVARPATGD